MNQEELINRNLLSEIKFSTSRSSGPGGQNVNKVNTKVELRFNVVESNLLSESEKKKVLSRLRRKINSKSELIIISQSERTQLMNKRRAEEKFFKLLQDALTDVPVRKATGPTKSSVSERLDKKRKRSNIKKLRNDSEAIREDY